MIRSSVRCTGTPEFGATNGFPRWFQDEGEDGRVAAEADTRCAEIPRRQSRFAISDSSRESQ